MRLKLLGTGDSGGVPVWGCECALCHRARSVTSLRRRPTSAALTAGSTSLLIDAGRSDLSDLVVPGSVRGVLLTHFHVDHVQGLFPLRWGSGSTLPVWCPPDPDGCADLYRHPGVLDFRPVEAFTPFDIGPVQVTAIPLEHSKLCFGWLVAHAGKHLAWLSDTIGLGAESLAFLAEHSIDLAVVDCTHPPSNTPPRNHNGLDQALDVIAELAPKRALLVHLSHHCARYFEEHSNGLPRQVSVAHDGLTVAIA